MVKDIFLLCVFPMLSFGISGQTTNKIHYATSLECYALEAYNSWGEYLNYAGQTGIFHVRKTLSNHLVAGISGGVYLHFRESRIKPNVYLYAPLQLEVIFQTKNQRFGIEISTGYPFKLAEYQPYLFVEKGFWYKDVYSENPEQEFQQNNIRKRDAIFLFSNLRFRFRLSHNNHWFLTTGIRVINYRERSKEFGLNGKEYPVDGILSYSNLSLGLEYRF